MPQPDLLQPKRVLKITKQPHPQFLNTAFLDPYVGCEFGCAYCYAIKEDVVDEGTLESPFRVGAKTNCVFALKKELEEIAEENPDPKLGKVSIGISFATDPYQPSEEKFQLTLRSLEIAKEAHYPVQIITKSELILRDVKLLAELSKEGLCVVSISLCSVDDEVAKAFEPRVSSPRKRLELIYRLREKGVTAGAFLMPIFPYVTDTAESIETAYAMLHDAGAQYCVPGILSLSQKAVKDRVLRILSEKFPRACYQYSVLYNAAGEPSQNYCAKVLAILKSSSEKYGIPSVLPVLGYTEKQDLIVRDAI